MWPLKINFIHMKKKLISLTGILCFCFSTVPAQRVFNEKIFPGDGQEVSFYFEYPELVTVTTSDRDDIEITGSIRINNGLNDDAFTLEINDEGETLSIVSTIKNLEKLPKMLMIKRGDTKYYFDNIPEHDQALQRLKEQYGQNSFGYSSHGVIKEITLQIDLPANQPFTIESKFGMLEITSVNIPIKAISKFGGIDMSLPHDSKRNLEVSTRFGAVYTDLDLVIEKTTPPRPNQWSTIHGKLNGGGQKCHLESKFGNIYLRKHH